MKVEELKKSIENKSYKLPFLIMKWQDNSFIATQYADEISRILRKEILYVNSPEELEDVNEIFEYQDNTLKVYITNELTMEYKPTMSNVVIICKTLKDCKGIDDFVVSIPKLESWQILSYMKYKCPKLNEDKLVWLQKITNNDIYRIDNELSKLSIFDDQNEIFDKLVDEGGFSDLTAFTMFNLTNSIGKRDVNEIKSILYSIGSIDVDAYGLTTVLLKDFKNTLGIQTTTYSFEKLGLTQKQYNAIKYYNCNKYSTQKLLNCYKFLLEYDSKLKDGVYQNVNSMIDYIICKVLG